MVSLLRLPRLRRRGRYTVLIVLLFFYAVYYTFFSSTSPLPEDLLLSPIYHPPPNSNITQDEHGRWVLSGAPLSAGTLGLAYGSDGLVRGWEAAHQLGKGGAEGVLPKRARHRIREIRQTHPIVELMQRGKERWESLLERQSRTLPQAVAEYTWRYNRPPPAGFELWWQFCKKNGVKIVDDYDQIDRDIEPYFALSPKEFRKRAAALDEQQHSYQISLSPTRTPSLTGPRAHSARGKHLFHLLAPLSTMLPTPIKITVSDHDMGNWLLGDDQLQAAREHIKRKKFFSETELTSFERREGRGEVKGMMSACPVGSRGWVETLEGQRGREVAKKSSETTFIHDPYPTYDLCHSPSLMSTHGSHSFNFPRESILRPLFQLSKFARDPSFLTTPLEAYENHTASIPSAKYTPWEDKAVHKLFWRGSSTGDHYNHRKGYDWRKSHRPRLHFMAQMPKRDDKAEKVGMWVAKKGGEWEWEEWEKGRVNEKYMDVGLTGHPHQCTQEDGTCDEMAKEIKFKGRVRPEDAVKYKYVLDVDGNGWSSRFHRLLMSGSMVIKATIYQEWQSDWMIPWYHYVPTQIDYSDLYSILSFFIGPPNDYKGELGHDDLARQIAEQGREFGINHWRWEDMQAYMLRMLLEYSRLMADDRDAASYQKVYT